MSPHEIDKRLKELIPLVVKGDLEARIEYRHLLADRRRSLFKVVWPSGRRQPVANR